MKRIITLLLITVLAVTVFTGCGNNNQTTQPAPAPQAEQNAQTEKAPATTPEPVSSNFNDSREITVVSREDGSGTRGAFIELTGVQETVDGNVTDRTTVEASIQNGTNAIMTNVSGDTYAIGYISTGSINDSIKTLSVDGVEPTAANILAGQYKISRPFIIVTQDNLSPVALEFIDFIMSAQGQEIVGGSYIPVVDNAPTFESAGVSGKIEVGGSTSVSPVMEKLAEGYLAINPNATIEIHSTGSGAGITGATEGVLDIGMSSREIKDSEMENLHQKITICKDGIAVIVNNDNPRTNISLDDIRDIFIGEKTRWNEIQ